MLMAKRKGRRVLNNQVARFQDKEARKMERKHDTHPNGENSLDNMSAVLLMLVSVTQEYP
jgi:hypothetical protein